MAAAECPVVVELVVVSVVVECPVAAESPVVECPVLVECLVAGAESEVAAASRAVRGSPVAEHLVECLVE